MYRIVARYGQNLDLWESCQVWLQPEFFGQLQGMVITPECNGWLQGKTGKSECIGWLQTIGLEEVNVQDGCKVLGQKK